ncbi:MAG: prolipoprotein diacylglyceryl transferase, partial [Spirochaetaceae bacterium]|nr:prolipoprotein diacylglyceryl transferase [Spirochaetaceae bacterium]
MNLYIPYPEWISPTIFPGLPIRWYGLMYLVAFGIAYGLTMLQLRQRTSDSPADVNRDQITDLFFWMILGVIVGGRIVAATLYDTSGVYLSKPWLVFWPFDEHMNFTGLAGMSYHGGLIGGLIAFLIYSKKKHLPILATGDLLAASIPLGYTFGRIGNFLNHELYGRITTAPWGVLFPHARRLPTGDPVVRETAEIVGIDISGQSLVNLPRHPSQLYEALLEGVILWLVLWFVFRKRKPFDGFMIGAYLIGYSIARFIAEYFRTPDAGLD